MAAKKPARKTGKQTIKSPGKPAVTFQKGGLHSSLGVPQGKKIPVSKVASAQAGNYGPKAKKQANFAMGMLKAGRQTAARNRSTKGK